MERGEGGGGREGEEGGRQQQLLKVCRNFLIPKGAGGGGGKFQNGFPLPPSKQEKLTHLFLLPVAVICSDHYQPVDLHTHLHSHQPECW